MAEQKDPKPLKLDRTYTPEQADLIRSLEEHPGFQFLWRELRKQRIIALNNAMDPNRSKYEIGLHDGFMRAINFPQMIIADSIDDGAKRLPVFPSEFLSEEDLVDGA